MHRVGPLDITGLAGLAALTPGDPSLTVAVIDGPADLSHPDLAPARIESLGEGGCRSRESQACRHATYILGLLAAARGGRAPAICPACRFLLRPLLTEDPADPAACPRATAASLARAIRETVAAGARLVNLSLEITSSEGLRESGLEDALELARRRGALVVAAAGNGGRVGCAWIASHPWVVPVVACDPWGRALPGSTLGRAVGLRGVRAPGAGVTSLAPGGGHARLDGSSTAAALVTGALALLWSLHPAASAAELRRAVVAGKGRRSIVPPLLDALESRRRLL